MIHGVNEPKFLVGTTTVNLDNTVLDSSWGITDEIEQKSILNGEKTWVTLGDYAEFTVNVNLFKYADPVAKFQELYAYNHKDVDQFFPHRDGVAVQKATGGNCKFHIAQIKLSYLGNNEKLDTLSIHFVANSYVNEGASVV